MTLTLPLQTVGPGKEQAPARGTIAIRLARASLAVRVEVIAHAEGFAVLDPASDDPGATADIVVSDDAEFVAQCGAEWSIQLVEAAESARDGKHMVASEADLLDMLPRILDEVADG